MRLAPSLLSLLLLLGAGCASGVDGPSASPASTDARGDDGLVLATGAVVAHGGGFLANVTAHNVSGRTLTVSQPFCVGTPWQARLSGPGGDGLPYRPPGYQLGCSGRSYTLAPGAWSNWTATPGCTTRTVCDNEWDGNLHGPEGPRRAPAGVYTWTFTFPYHLEPEGTAGPDAAERRRTVELPVRLTLH